MRRPWLLELGLWEPFLGQASLCVFVRVVVDLGEFLGLCCFHLWGAHEFKWVWTLLGSYEGPWCIFGRVSVDVCSCIIISWPWWTLWIGLGASSWRDLVGWWCLCTWLILYVLVCLSLGHLAWLLLSHVLLKARLSPCLVCSRTLLSLFLSLTYLGQVLTWRKLWSEMRHACESWCMFGCLSGPLSHLWTYDILLMLVHV